MTKPVPSVLIVAHGQPSDPEPAAAEIAALASEVAALLPDRRVRSATLAEPDALAREIAEWAGEGLVYPLFMADGWFTATHLPERLAAAGARRWRILPPFGRDAGVQALAVRCAREAGLLPGGALLLAAHGSFRSPAPSEVAREMAARIGRELGLARAEAAFIDQTPRLSEARGFGPASICLPFFAARGGHVIDDLPAALAEAGFEGRLLGPLGLDPRVPGLIADAVRRADEAQIARSLT